MGMLGQHGDSTAARAQHGDSMEAARQPELSMETAWGCWVSMETALRKDRQGGISFSEEKGKKKEEGRISGFVCCVCVLLCYCYIFYCLFFLRYYYPIFLRRLLSSHEPLVWHPPLALQQPLDNTLTAEVNLVEQKMRSFISLFVFIAVCGTAASVKMSLSAKHINILKTFLPVATIPW